MRSSYRILVVDDEEDILSITKKSLERYGHVADTFSSSLQAFEQFKQDPLLYDIVISDIRMPGIKGYELLKKVKQLNPSVKVFLMSAYEMWESPELTSEPEVKVDDFLQKPFPPDSLCVTIRKHMAK